MRYVELNPVRAGLAAHAGDWRWSTAGFHLGHVTADPLVESGRWRASWDADSWREALAVGIPEQALLDRIRDATRNGRPLGSEHFAAEIEHLLRRPVRPQKRGPSVAQAGTNEADVNFEVA